MTSLLQTAKELLDTKDILHPKIFDHEGKMLPDVRQKIMKIAEVMIKQRIEGLYGFTVADIVIVGSAGSYMYTDNSDIDVKIFLATTNPTIKSLSQFSKYCCYRDNIDEDFFFVNGLLLDISYGPLRYDSGGNYSVLKDCWVTKPRKDKLSERFTPGEIVRGYYQLCESIYRSISEYDFCNGTLPSKNIREFEKMRRELFLAKYKLEQNYDENIKNFLIYRLFAKVKKLKYLFSFQEQIEKDFYNFNAQFNKTIKNCNRSFSNG